MRAVAQKQRRSRITTWGGGKPQQESLRLSPVIEKAGEEPPACEPIADAALGPIIEGAAKTQRLEPDLLRVVIQQEAAFYPCAVSGKGAKGLT